LSRGLTHTVTNLFKHSRGFNSEWCRKSSSRYE
jgi:hypothetical protein